MLPIAVFRFSPSEGPAHFGDWLSARGLPWRLVPLDDGAAVPASAADFSGIGLMGGPMSVNDALAWSAPLEALLRHAVAVNVPVLGHCLGGQLLARALGARVVRSAVPEIGWIDVEACSDAATAWLGGRSRFTAFQWHYDAFDLPPGATPILTNAHNRHQAYVVDDRHVGLQCHVEMTPALVQAWCDSGAEELPARTSATLQSRDDVLRGVGEHLPALSQVADDLYARWARGLRH